MGDGPWMPGTTLSVKINRVTWHSGPAPGPQSPCSQASCAAADLTKTKPLPIRWHCFFLSCCKGALLNGPLSDCLVANCLELSIKKCLRYLTLSESEMKRSRGMPGIPRFGDFLMLRILRSTPLFKFLFYSYMLHILICNVCCIFFKLHKFCVSCVRRKENLDKGLWWKGQKRFITSPI